MSTVYTLYLGISRIAMPILIASLLFLWIIIFKKSKRKNEALAFMQPEFGENYGEIFSRESLVGKSHRCEVRLEKSPHKRHALITLEKDGFFVEPLNGKVAVNDEPIYDKTPISVGDFITFNKEMYRLCLPEEEDEPCKVCKGTGFMLLIFTLFQVLLCGQVYLSPNMESGYIFPASIGGMILIEWIYYIVLRVKNGHAKMFIEIPTAFLLSLGLTICYSCTPEEYVKQLVCIGVGIVGAFILRSILSGLSAVTALRYVVAVIALGLLGVNLIFGTTVYGSRNWLDLGFVSFQPSEVVKVAYIFFGGVVLSKKELSKMGIFIFLVFSALCMGTIAIMRDFGAVAIFFVTMVVLLMMRHAPLWITGGITGLAAVSAVGVITFLPYVADRFAAWTKVWQYADSLGYQQTRTIIACASGGLFGVGAGNGYLKNITAADTDLVFGIVSEEFGGIISFAMAMCFVLFAVYAVDVSKRCRSSYYAGTACAAAGMLLFQTALNIFGSVDILPLTGVTIPFVSNGGTSIISGLCILAFFKAAEVESKLPETIRRRYY